MLEYPIKIKYHYTNNNYTAYRWLINLPNLFAADFETASKYTQQEKNTFLYRLQNQKLSFEEHRLLLQKYTSNGLSHPSLSVITHFSMAYSNTEGFVIICDNDNIRKLVCNFLVTTDKTQIWHNACFDFLRIHYLTNRVPKNYLDTQLMAKSLLNNANPLKDKTGLKELMEYAYGDWAVSKDSFTLEEMWKEETIRYSATDSCATFKLYEDIQKELNKWSI